MTPESPHDDAVVAATDTVSITVYWRPGCPFCSSLTTALLRAGVAFHEIDIWSDPDAAATVRSITGGNETVPTVTIETATGSVALVNPSAREVIATAGSGEQPARR